MKIFLSSILLIVFSIILAYGIRPSPEIKKHQIEVEYIPSIPVVFTRDVPPSNEVFYLAATMWGEARGEGAEGMGYVGHVIMNRVRAHFRGTSVSDVVLYPRQFSCWNSEDPNAPKLNIAYLEQTQGAERETWEAAKELANQIIRGTTDYTNGATFYHADYVKPNWSGSYEITARFGKHIFYR